MAFNWYTTLPGDSDIVSQHPANERAFRTTVNAAFGVEHATAEGRHQFGVGNTAARDAISTWTDGAIWFSTQDARTRLQVRSGGVWVNSGEFITGTSIIFRQATAPVGWSQHVDVTDRMLRIVSSGLTSGGAWAISGLATGGAHTHLVSGTSGNQSANHHHFVSGTTSVPSASANRGTNNSLAPDCATDAHTHTVAITSGVEDAVHTHSISITSGAVSATHTHAGDGTWRPLYTDVIAAGKD